MADRVFLDANVLFSAAYRADSGLRRLWELDDTRLLTSQYAIYEARRNLDLPERLQRLDDLLERVETVPSATVAEDARRSVNLPEKDGPIVASAAAANSSHLVTGDKTHFGPYFGTRLLDVEVLTPAAYLASRTKLAS